MERRSACACHCHRQLFGFHIEEQRKTEFVLSQWTDRPVLYALYRSLVSLYTIGVVVYTAINNEYGVKIFIWLTYWSYYILATGFLIRALTVWLHVYGQKDKDRLRLPDRLLQVQWILQTLTCATAPVVCVLFWTVVYQGAGVDFTTVNTHAINLSLVVLDLYISRYPIRVHHFYVGMCFFTTYSVFTAIYWATGGTNHLGRPYVYSALNYTEDPGYALIFVFSVTLAAVPLIHCVMYGLYRSRVAVWNRCRRAGEDGVQETLVALTTQSSATDV
ncbi:protein rolling stone-like [Haliotis rubra]|uniref:protein rolling stone-like n=1 Tax=Haliotis rubra TaxID=36100 RepID=UPI001EE58EA3|nr:protein rolling stone-like [Haliotis rubra]